MEGDTGEDDIAFGAVTLVFDIRETAPTYGDWDVVELDDRVMCRAGEAGEDPANAYCCTEAAKLVRRVTSLLALSDMSMIQ